MLENISPKDLDFIYCLLETHPEHSETIFKLASLIHKAARIYIARATGVTHDVIAYLVQQFLTEASIFNASSPGGHILIWPFFIVGAECTSDRDREFISIQLQKLWELTGFGNIVYAIQFLRTVWQKDSGENWTHNLAEEAKGFIM
ncbi:hypothetical protein Plec18167_009100 [Paecilomyces lecythidis]|uniref:Uncharacterized protein n=1 Tax=Paecilomyces lecythidis TaxID=3004212 RepID=A0ABR3WRI2_9EURO